MNKNIIYLFGIAFALSFCLHGCYKIENNRRVAVMGSLVDDSGNPVSGILVQSSGDHTLLGSATSDEFGMFSFASLESNADDFSIAINPEPARDTLYPPITYINSYIFKAPSIVPKRGKRTQNSYDLGKIHLRRQAYLDLNIKKTSTANDTLHWRVTIPDSYCENYFSKGVIDTTRTRCFATLTQTGTIKPGDEDQNPGFGTIKNAEAIFDYTINSCAPQTITIPISQYRTNYVFEF